MTASTVRQKSLRAAGALITADGSKRHAAKAMKLGAWGPGPLAPSAFRERDRVRVRSRDRAPGTATERRARDKDSFRGRWTVSRSRPLPRHPKTNPDTVANPAVAGTSRRLFNGRSRPSSRAGAWTWGESRTERSRESRSRERGSHGH
jgi:hypothetical protein